MKLYREKCGHDKLLGTDTSDDNGKWAIPIGNKLTSGAYYATVAEAAATAGAKSRSDRLGGGRRVDC